MCHRNHLSFFLTSFYHLFDRVQKNSKILTRSFAMINRGQKGELNVRKVKVKVWHKEEAQWLNPSELIYCNGKWFETVQALQEGVALAEEAIEVVQSIGIKDRHGVEMYEGDIVTSEEYPFQSEGVYNYHGLVEWADELATYYVTKYLVNKKKRGISHLLSESLESYDVELFEVIGNQLEHPELLD